MSTLDTPSDRALGTDLETLDGELTDYISTQYSSAIAVLGESDPDEPPAAGTFSAMVRAGARAASEG